MAGALLAKETTTVATGGGESEAHIHVMYMFIKSAV